MIGGILAGSLTLIALQVFASGKGPERGGALLGWVGTGVQAFLSPDKAAIPTTRKLATSTAPPAAGTNPGSGGTGNGSPGPNGTPGAGVPVSLPRNPTLS